MEESADVQLNFCDKTKLQGNIPEVSKHFLKIIHTPKNKYGII